MRSFVVLMVSAGLIAACGGSRARSERVPRPSASTKMGTGRATLPSPVLVGVLVNSHRHLIARLRGQNSSAPTDASITQAVSDGRGGWYVAGLFTKLDGVREDRIAHILANGAVDRRWRSRLAPGEVVAMAATRASVYVAVMASARPAQAKSSPSGYAPTRLLAFSARTGATESVPANPRYPITAMTVAASRLLIGQGAGSSPHAPSCLLVYDTRTRKIAPGFHAVIHLAAGSKGNACVQALVIDAQQLYVGGTFDHVNGLSRPSLARFDVRTGALDPDWRPQHHPGLPASVLAVGDGLVITNIGNGGLGALSAATGKVDRQWVWPPPHETPGAGLHCCATPRAIVGSQLLIASDSPEVLAAINLRTETLTRYPDYTTIDAAVNVATRSGDTVLAGFTGG